MAAAFSHTTVLLDETVDALAVRAGGRYVDGTLGGGGHARAILERSAPDGRLMGLDRDEAALAHCQNSLGQRYGERFVARQSSFAELGEQLDALGWSTVDGIVLDLGVSSHQIDTPTRGFSFSADGPLDMRMGPDASQTAEQLIATSSERELADILYGFGEEKKSRRLARLIKQAQAAGELRTTADLAAVCWRGLGGKQGKIHPATRTFQALRIAVNDELGALDRFLDQMLDWLAPAGRVAIISFHSLEDRRVKQRFSALSNPSANRPPGLPPPIEDPKPLARLVTRKPVVPRDKETDENPRARSAKLRVLERLS
jgi:16S rRNA (cytosine1402-N4)-methyltransferase